MYPKMNTESRSLGEELEKQGVGLGTWKSKSKGVALRFGRGVQGTLLPEYVTLFGEESVGDLNPIAHPPDF